MKVHVRLFSVAKDLAGFRERTLDLEVPSSAAAVMDVLTETNPRFAEWRSAMRIAVNQQYVQPDHPLNDGDEVAVIPPVSGG